MTTDFTAILFRLSRADVDFVIIGGFAASVYGCTIVTQDIDICCDFAVENLLRIQKALADINPVHRMTTQKTKLALTPSNCADLKNLYLDTDLGVLDCLSHVDGVGDFKEVKNTSREIIVDQVTLSVLNIDSLINSKTTLNRPRDRQTAIQLKAIKKLTDHPGCINQ